MKIFPAAVAAVSMFLFLSANASAQCPTVPTDSPVLSNGPDDIPPSVSGWVLDWSGTYHKALANHQVAFVQISPTEQKVWFTINVDGSSSQPPPQYPVYYNRRYRADTSSPWYWEFSSSIQVMDINNGLPDAVLYSPTAKYSDGGVYGTKYNYIMYLVNQPPACNGAIAGIAMVSYSWDGICWTTPEPLQHAGGPSEACAPTLGSNLVIVEALSPIDTGSQINLIGMEGDISILSNTGNMDTPYASWGYSDPASSNSVTIPASPMISASGIFQPNFLSAYDPTRYKSYAYFFNMSVAWDAANGDLYVSRGYPYPMDRSGSNVSGPSQQVSFFYWNSYFNYNEQVQTCGSGPSIYPNRYQIYRMHLGALSNFGQITTGSWTLVADRGGQTGYGNGLNSAWNNSTPLVYGQTAGDRDAGAATFVRDSAGNLVRDTQAPGVLAGNTLRQTLSSGPCQTTGMENERLDSLP